MSEFLTEHQKAVQENRKRVRAIYLQYKGKATRLGIDVSRWKLCTMTANDVNMTAAGVSKILKDTYQL